MVRSLLVAVTASVLLSAAFGCATLKSAPEEPDGGESPSAAEPTTSPPGSGRSSLPSEAADGGCTPSKTDPRNCGRCGKSCRGGACVDGLCGPAVLADMRNSPADIAQLASYVYWVEQGTFEAAGRDGRLVRAPKTGCAADAGACGTELADGGVNFAGVAVDTAFAYVAAGSLSTGAVSRLALTGGPLTSFGAASEVGARRIAIDKATSSVFWVNAGNADGTGTLRRRWIDASGPAATIVANLDFPAAVATLNGRVFFSVRGKSGFDFDGSIRACDADGKNPVVVATSQGQPRGVAVDTSRVYWVNRADGTVRAAKWSGAEATVLVPNGVSPNAVAVDADGVYWTEAGTDPDRLDGRVRRADLDGKNVRTLASAVPEPLAIAVDADAVYVAVRGTRDNLYRDGRILVIVK